MKDFRFLVEDWGNRDIIYKPQFISNVSPKIERKQKEENSSELKI